LLKNIDACIFDLDGTLVDSMWVWGAVDIEYLGKHGCSVPPDMKDDIEGSSMREIAVYFQNRFNIHDSVEKIIEDWNIMALDKYSNSVPMKPHIDEFLAYLKENNIKVGLYTSNSYVLTEAALKGHNILQYFDAITSGCSDIKGKPEPDGYLLTADKLGVSYDRCLVFEDLVMGIWAGKKAGMKTCAIKDDYSAAQDEEKAKLADYYIEDYYEVFKS